MMSLVAGLLLIAAPAAAGKQVQWAQVSGFTGMLYSWSIPGSATETLRDVLAHFSQIGKKDTQVMVYVEDGEYYSPKMIRDEALPYLVTKIKAAELEVTILWNLTETVMFEGSQVKVLGGLKPEIPELRQALICVPVPSGANFVIERKDLDKLETTTRKLEQAPPGEEEPFAIKLLHPENRDEVFSYLRLAETSYQKSVPDGCHELVRDSTRVIYCWAGKQLQLAFRGTDSFADLITDFQFSGENLTQFDIFGSAVTVHKGFLKAYRSIRAELHRLLKSTAVDNVIVVGHSLGGALATFAAADFAAHGFRSRIQAVTFGSPRVGDSRFRNTYLSFGIPTARFVNRFDPVHGVPPGDDTVDPRMSFVQSILMIAIGRAPRSLEISKYEHVVAPVELDGIVGSIRFWGTAFAALNQLWAQVPNGTTLQKVWETRPKDKEELWKHIRKSVSSLSSISSNISAREDFSVLTAAIFPHFLRVYKESLERAFMGIFTILGEVAFNKDSLSLLKFGWKSISRSTSTASDLASRTSAVHKLVPVSSLASTGVVASTSSFRIVVGMAVAPLAALTASTPGTWYGLYKANEKLDGLALEAKYLSSGVSELKNFLEILPIQICERLHKQTKQDELEDVASVLKVVDRDLVLDSKLPEPRTEVYLWSKIVKLSDWVVEEASSRRQGEQLPRVTRKPFVAQVLNFVCSGFSILLHVSAVRNPGCVPRAIQQHWSASLRLALFTFAWHCIESRTEYWRSLPALPELLNNLLLVGVKLFDGPFSSKESLEAEIAVSEPMTVSQRVRYLVLSHVSDVPMAAGMWFLNTLDEIIDNIEKQCSGSRCAEAAPSVITKLAEVLRRSVSTDTLRAVALSTLRTFKGRVLRFLHQEALLDIQELLMFVPASEASFVKFMVEIALQPPHGLMVGNVLQSPPKNNIYGELHLQLIFAKDKIFLSNHLYEHGPADGGCRNFDDRKMTQVLWAVEKYDVSSLHLHCDSTYSKIYESGAKILAIALEKSRLLTELSLDYQFVGSAAVSHVVQALKKNQFLTALTLDLIDVDDAGAVQLALALEENQALTSLTLTLCSFNDAFALQLAVGGWPGVLTRLLILVDCSCYTHPGDRCSDQDLMTQAERLAKAVKRNQVLTKVHINHKRYWDGHKQGSLEQRVTYGGIQPPDLRREVLDMGDTALQVDMKLPVDPSLRITDYSTERSEL